MTIDITDRFVVHAGQSFAFTDEVGFLLSGDAGPTLVNAGSISSHITAAADPGASAVRVVAADATVWNKAGADITFTADAGAAASAIEMDGQSGVLRNDGDILVRADSAMAVIAGGLGLRLVNTGSLDAHGVHDAETLQLYVDARIDNSGVISARADEACAISLHSTGDAFGSLDNTGLIVARGGASAIAVGLAGRSVYHLTNAGHIVASTAPDGLASVGVVLQSSELSGVVSLIENSGVIRAQVALHMSQSFGDFDVDNSGKLIGDVTFGYGSDQLVNTGLIRGAVDLGFGDDLYDGTDGRLVGSLMGGFGADTLIGGLGADSFRYDQLIESTLVSSDLIQGLQSIDLIDLSRIDADPSHEGQQHLTSGQVTLTYDSGSGNTWLDVDTGGEAGPEMRIVIAGDHTDFTGIVL